jgi:hypothetical protein
MDKLLPAVEPRLEDLLLVASSFEEERCLAASAKLGLYQARACIVINFTASTTAEGEARKRRTAQKLLRQVAEYDAVGLPRLLSVGPYAYEELFSLVVGELERRDISGERLKATIDISCLTRIQLAFLVRSLLFEFDTDILRLLYTVPRSYNHTKGDKFSRLGVGCFRPVALPLRRWPGHGAVTTRRGALVLLGHEGQRTLAAWRRIDPDEALLIEAISGDDELEETCRAENEHLFKIVRALGDRAAVRQVSRLEIDGAQAIISSWLEAFSGDPSAIISIVPLGPKPLVVAALLACMAVPRLTVEIVYPMASRYNTNYSEDVVGVYSETFSGSLANLVNGLGLTSGGES